MVVSIERGFINVRSSTSLFTEVKVKMTMISEVSSSLYILFYK